MTPNRPSLVSPKHRVWPKTHVAFEGFKIGRPRAPRAPNFNMGLLLAGCTRSSPITIATWGCFWGLEASDLRCWDGFVWVPWYWRVNYIIMFCLTLLQNPSAWKKTGWTTWVWKNAMENKKCDKTKKNAVNVAKLRHRQPHSLLSLGTMDSENWFCMW